MYLIYIDKMRAKNSYKLDEIGNMDETPVFINMPTNTTIDKIGSKSISIAT